MMMPKHIPAIAAGPQSELLLFGCWRSEDAVVAYFEEQGRIGMGLLLLLLLLLLFCWGSVEVWADEGPVEFGGTKYMANSR